MSFLKIQNLNVEYKTRSFTSYALRNVNLELERGESLGLVGESGCGKSTLASTILQLLAGNAEVVSGEIELEGRNLTSMSAEAMRQLRWKHISYVPQNAGTSLSPVSTLFNQFIEAWTVHEKFDHQKLRTRAAELFRDVELAERWLDSYPHQLSGGMRQRAIIALALLFEPTLLVADEPTTGLDVIVQRQVLEVIKRIQKERKMSLVFVSHDIGVIAELCQNLAVMYAGEIIEVGRTRDILREPAHPYTMALKRSFPDLRYPDAELVSIPGQPPSLTDPPRGCVFAERCPFAQDVCHQMKPATHSLADNRKLVCHFVDRIDEMRGLIETGKAIYPMETVS